jgi:N-methylhydantoinase B/oxoprolinase/acetone carboxylase alpha subunit
VVLSKTRGKLEPGEAIIIQSPTAGGYGKA